MFSVVVSNTQFEVEKSGKSVFPEVFVCYGLNEGIK
jgi:hypothetical protein